MKIVLAIDSFKGSLTSLEVEQAIAEVIHANHPDYIIDCIPIADGGEGTLSILLEQAQGTYHTITAHNPCMEKIDSSYGISPDLQTAFIEMAAISGLPLIKEHQKNPMKTTSFGTGELIRDALEMGCKTIILGIGGSATNDAGTGLLQALGYRFLDKDGNELGLGGEILEKVTDIDDSLRHPLLKNAHFIVACDVQNPFFGTQGATCVYARQKGADDTMIALLEKGMQHFSKMIQDTTGKDIAQIPGSGAAGGVGGSMLALLDAELKSGADLLLNTCRFEERTADADLIITGEGRIDPQSLMGKIPGKILQRGQTNGIPVIAIAGCVEDENLLKEAGFKKIYATRPENMPLKEAMEPEAAIQNIKETMLLVLGTELVPKTNNQLRLT